MRKSEHALLQSNIMHNVWCCVITSDVANSLDAAACSTQVMAQVVAEGIV
jgi:hypothetical protein